MPCMGICQSLFPQVVRDYKASLWLVKIQQKIGQDLEILFFGMVLREQQSVSEMGDEPIKEG